MTDEEIGRMVEAVRSISDPVKRLEELEKLVAQIATARRDISVLRWQTVNELRALRDDQHPEGWSLTDIGRRIGKPRGTIQYISEGRGLAKADGEQSDAQ